MRKLITIGAALLLTISMGLGVASAVDAPKGPIQVTNYGKKEPVHFNHDKHVNNLKCEQCHHKAGDTADSYKCGGCHAAEADGDKPALKDAAHKKEVGKCYECHRKKGAEQEKKCKDCHGN